MPPPTPAPPRFSESGRSGTRMLISMPVLLEGIDVAGTAYKETTRTIVIHRGGAKVSLTKEVVVGSRMHLTISNSQSSRESGATVVWVGEKKKDQLEIGIDLDQADNFWGVIFPDDSGTFQAPLGSIGSQQPASGSNTPTSSASPPQTSAPNLPPSN